MSDPATSFDSSPRQKNCVMLPSVQATHNGDNITLPPSLMPTPTHLPYHNSTVQGIRECGSVLGHLSYLPNIVESIWMHSRSSNFAPVVNSASAKITTTQSY